MKIRCLWIIAICGLSLPAVWAKGGEVFDYQAKVDMKLFGVDTSVPMGLSVFSPQDQSERLNIQLIGDASPLISGLPAHLEREVDARHRGCRERWDGRDAAAIIEDNALSLRITVGVEKWVCERVFGSDVKTRLASEAGTIHAVLGASVNEGRLQVALQSFAVSGLSDLSKELNVEGLLRDELKAEIRKFNADTAATTLPSPWAENGYRLESVVLSQHPQPSITVLVSGPNDVAALLSILKHLES